MKINNGAQLTVINSQLTAIGRKCNNCGTMNHFAKTCPKPQMKIIKQRDKSITKLKPWKIQYTMWKTAKTFIIPIKVHMTIFA